MEIRAEIVLKGRVQKAGYRDHIDEVAFDLDIKGWVRNLEDGTVRIVCEGKKQDIEKFISGIKIREYPIRVDDAIIEFLPATGEFRDFTIIKEEDIVFATYERMDAAGRYMREMNRNLGNKLDKSLEKQDIMIEKQDIMIEKQDIMIEKQDIMIEKQDIMIEKQDIMIGKQDIMIGKEDNMLEKQDIMIGNQDSLQDTVENVFKEAKEEIHFQRDDFKEVFMSEVNELRGEVKELRQRSQG
jgi:acylphosphatase